LSATKVVWLQLAALISAMLVTGKLAAATFAHWNSDVVLAAAPVAWGACGVVGTWLVTRRVLPTTVGTVLTAAPPVEFLISQGWSTGTALDIGFGRTLWIYAIPWLIGIGIIWVRGLRSAFSS
jgi:hypothetical protein